MSTPMLMETMFTQTQLWTTFIILSLILWEFLYYKFIKYELDEDDGWTKFLFMKTATGLLAAAISTLIFLIVAVLIELLKTPLIFLGILGLIIFIAVNVVIGMHYVKPKVKSRKKKR